VRSFFWLVLNCPALPGFSFVHKGHRINAETTGGNSVKASVKPAEQLTLGFERQFDLTKRQGTVKVKVRRPPGRIGLSISLDEKAS
jgi:hypothetical protein